MLKTSLKNLTQKQQESSLSVIEMESITLQTVSTEWKVTSAWVLNTSNKSVNSIGKADLATGETYAVDIEHYVNKAGLKVDYDKRRTVKNTISAYGSLKYIYKKHGGEHLYDVLTLSKEIYGDTYFELQAWNLKGTSEFIATFPE